MKKKSDMGHLPAVFRIARLLDLSQSPRDDLQSALATRQPHRAFSRELDAAPFQHQSGRGDRVQGDELGRGDLVFELFQASLPKIRKALRPRAAVESAVELKADIQAPQSDRSRDAMYISFQRLSASVRMPRRTRKA